MPAPEDAWQHAALHRFAVRHDLTDWRGAQMYADRAARGAELLEAAALEAEPAAVRPVVEHAAGAVADALAVADEPEGVLHDVAVRVLTLHARLAADDAADADEVAAWLVDLQLVRARGRLVCDPAVHAPVLGDGAIALRHALDAAAPSSDDARAAAALLRDGLDAVGRGSPGRSAPVGRDDGGIDPASIDALLEEPGGVERAWAEAERRAPLPAEIWLRLADATAAPEGAVRAFERIADAPQRDARGYRRAITRLRRLRAASRTGPDARRVDRLLLDLRERYRDRPDVLGDLARAGV